jgi:hypothetical protein
METSFDEEDLMKRQKHPEEMPLYFPRSNATTESNKTGSWRYFRPSYAEKTAPCSAACPVGQDIRDADHPGIAYQSLGDDPGRKSISIYLRTRLFSSLRNGL